MIVVIPNHLPHLDFLQEWDELRDTKIIVVQDSRERPCLPDGFDITVFTHQDIDRELGKNSWIIPRRTSAIRSFGYWKAWQTGEELVATLDNDCYPEKEPWLIRHRQNLNSKVTLDWVSSTTQETWTRGFPYLIRDQADVFLSHGLWSNVPDLDAATALQLPNLRFQPATEKWTIPRHSFFPMCGMNLAWRRELTPALYFGLFGEAYGLDQYDDIWAGVLCKRVLDHLGFAVVTGCPSVEHRRQSDVFVNLRKQASGMFMNELFWRAVKDIELTATTITGSYRQLIEGLPDSFPTEPDGWTRKFKQAALTWSGLFT